MNTKPTPPPDSLGSPSGSAALRVEIWECRACGKDAPCRVEITHQPTKYPHIEVQPRFTTRNRGCICDERLDPAWVRLPNAQALPPKVGQ
jgi:hypothetical protein